jgi:flagellar hook-length control protein FliK
MLRKFLRSPVNDMVDENVRAKIRELEEKNAELQKIWDNREEKIADLEIEVHNLKELNRELRRINNKIMDQLEQKTRLVNYYRREKAKRDRFIDL